MAKGTQNKSDGRYTDTRQRVLQAAKAAYYQGGYAGMSLQEMAESVGITKAALFHHFKSKQELFFAVALDICEDYQRTISQAITTASDTSGQLRNILLALTTMPFFDPMKFLADEFHQLNGEQQQQIQSVFEAAFNLPIRGVVEQGLQAGHIRVQNPQLATDIFLNFAMLLPAPGHPAMPSDMSHSQLEKYVDGILDIFFYGLLKAET